MTEENLPAGFFKHFFSEELYSVPEGNKMDPAGSALPGTLKNENPAEAVKPKNMAATAQTAPQDALPFVVKGDNGKKVAVILNLFDQDFAKLKEQKLLMAILAAIKLSPADVAFVNITGQVNDLKEIAEEVNFENAILFLNPKHSLITHHKLKPFQPMSINGKYVIAGAELSALQTYKEQKAQLWTGLQAMFL
ncbi:MAG: hypothetical protein EOP53_21560 [Sphingobacteriales bacterium]|nr:MAG: hypothetical protein EOP53_21560 [Sphingobacteriales bacterium]